MQNKFLFLTVFLSILAAIITWKFHDLKPSQKADMGLGFQQEISGKAKPRIVGGVEAKKTDWPWVAGILYSGVQSNYSAQFCGGSVIHQNWVVTAAHCVDRKYGSRNLEPQDIKILVGGHNLAEGDGRRISVKRIVVHPYYDGTRYINDIALIELEEPAGVETLPLFEGQDDLAGENAIAIGWGSMSSDRNSPSYPNTRQQVTLPIAEQWLCNATYGSLVKESMICAGVPEGGKDSCQGDSGGPLVVYDESNWKLAGITSWGVGCAQPGKFGVYTRASSYIDFIRDYVPAENNCRIIQKSFKIGVSSIPETGTPVTFNVEAASECGSGLYYNYSYAPDYGTANYDEENGWIQILGGDGFSDSGSISVSFPARGYYVFVAKISTTREESEKTTIAGCTVAVRDNATRETPSCMIMPVSMTADTVNIPKIGDPVTFRVDAISECPGQIYYYYVYAPDYGTSNIHEIQGWQKMQAGDGFSTNKTIAQTFPKEGNYVVLALMAQTRNRADAIATIGMTISVSGE